jgi:hypothetical protein
MRLNSETCKLAAPEAASHRQFGLPLAERLARVADSTPAGAVITPNDTSGARNRCAGEENGVWLSSRFVLYDAGDFVLQYLGARSVLEYRGTYTESQRSVEFAFEDWSTAGSWGATAAVTEDTSTVEYNFIMQMSDFENGVYHRQR